MSSEDLEKSLRESINGYIESRLSGLQEEIQRLQSQVNEGFTRISERLTGETQADTSIAVAISEHLHAAHRRGTEDAAAESPRTKISSDVALLKAAVDDIDQQRTQVDILNALVNRAASFAPRVLFFVIKNNQAMGWRARGLEGTIGDDAVREISLPLSAQTLLSSAAESRATWSGAPTAYSENNLILDKLGSELPQRTVAVPLVARNRAVAVLYADSSTLDADAINLEALEALVRVAGMAVELLATQRPTPAETKIPAPPPHRSTFKPSREAPTSITAPPAPPAPPPQFTSTDAASSLTDTEFAPHGEAMQDEATPPPVEAEASFTSPSPGSGFDISSGLGTPSDQTAQASTPPPAEASYSAPLGSAKRYSDADLPIQVGEADKRLHNDARRFARLLVSEIKLYNEQKVKEGRENGDMYERLREEIDRSRQMYDKRIAPSVAETYDYFHHEIVNTLAEGDPEKLGASYPGATVSA